VPFEKKNLMSPALADRRGGIGSDFGFAGRWWAFLPSGSNAPRSVPPENEEIQIKLKQKALQKNCANNAAIVSATI
jgi:hypothetical protein